MFGLIHDEEKNSDVTFSVEFHYSTVDTVGTDVVSTVESRDETEEAHGNFVKPDHSTAIRVETPASLNFSKAQQSIEFSKNNNVTQAIRGNKAYPTCAILLNQLKVSWP